MGVSILACYALTEVIICLETIIKSFLIKKISCLVCLLSDTIRFFILFALVDYSQSQNILKQRLFAKVFSSPLRSMLMSLQFKPRPYCGQITDPQHCYREGEGALMKLSLSFLRESPNKLCFIKLRQNFCNWF